MDQLHSPQWRACWRREAKPCLSECSGCCSLLKCQVLYKNNTPSLFLAHSPSTGSMSASASSLLPPDQTPASAGAEVEKWTFASKANCSVSAAIGTFCLFIYFALFPPLHLPCGPWGGNSEGDAIKPFLSSLVLAFPVAATLPLAPCPFHTPSLLTLPMMMWCVV